MGIASGAAPAATAAAEPPPPAQPRRRDTPRAGERAQGSRRQKCGCGVTFETKTYNRRGTVNKEEHKVRKACFDRDRPPTRPSRPAPAGNQATAAIHADYDNIGAARIAAFRAPNIKMGQRVATQATASSIPAFPAAPSHGRLRQHWRQVEATPSRQHIMSGTKPAREHAPEMGENGDCHGVRGPRRLCH